MAKHLLVAYFGGGYALEAYVRLVHDEAVADDAWQTDEEGNDYVELDDGDVWEASDDCLGIVADTREEAGEQMIAAILQEDGDARAEEIALLRKLLAQ